MPAPYANITVNGLQPQADGALYSAPGFTFAKVTKGTDYTTPGTIARKLWVGGAGNVVIQGIDGTVATFHGATAGSIIDVLHTGVSSIGSTATELVAIF